MYMAFIKTMMLDAMVLTGMLGYHLNAQYFLFDNMFSLIYREIM